MRGIKLNRYNIIIIIFQELIVLPTKVILLPWTQHLVEFEPRHSIIYLLETREDGFVVSVLHTYDAKTVRSLITGFNSARCSLCEILQIK